MHTLIQDCLLLKLKFHQKSAGEGKTPRDHPPLAMPLSYTQLWDNWKYSYRDSADVCFLCLCILKVRLGNVINNHLIDWQVPAQFAFIAKLDDREYCKRWLTVKPHMGIITKGNISMCQFTQLLSLFINNGNRRLKLKLSVVYKTSFRGFKMNRIVAVLFLSSFTFFFPFHGRRHQTCSSDCERW